MAGASDHHHPGSPTGQQTIRDAEIWRIERAQIERHRLAAASHALEALRRLATGQKKMNTPGGRRYSRYNNNQVSSSSSSASAASVLRSVGRSVARCAAHIAGDDDAVEAAARMLTWGSCPPRLGAAAAGLLGDLGLAGHGRVVDAVLSARDGAGGGERGGDGGGQDGAAALEALLSMMMSSAADEEGASGAAAAEEDEGEEGDRRSGIGRGLDAVGRALEAARALEAVAGHVPRGCAALAAHVDVAPRLLSLTAPAHPAPVAAAAAAVLRRLVTTGLVVPDPVLNGNRNGNGNGLSLIHI